MPPLPLVPPYPSLPLPAASSRLLTGGSRNSSSSSNTSPTPPAFGTKPKLPLIIHPCLLLPTHQSLLTPLLVDSLHLLLRLSSLLLLLCNADSTVSGLSIRLFRFCQFLLRRLPVTGLITGWPMSFSHHNEGEDDEEEGDIDEEDRTSPSLPSLVPPPSAAVKPRRVPSPPQHSTHDDMDDGIIILVSDDDDI